MTHPRWKILRFNPPQVDLSMISLEEAFKLLKAENDIPVVIGSTEENAFYTDVVKYIEENHPNIMWVALPTEILKHDSAWYVWGHSCIVISEGVW